MHKNFEIFQYCNKHSSCCEDIPGCLCAMCLTPCYVYLTVEKTGESTGCAILSCCCPIATICVRGNVREKKGIDGSCMGDFCSIFFCGCCTLIQMNREYGEWKHFLKIFSKQTFDTIRVDYFYPIIKTIFVIRNDHVKNSKFVMFHYDWSNLQIKPSTILQLIIITEY